MPYSDQTYRTVLIAVDSSQTGLGTRTLAVGVVTRASQRAVAEVAAALAPESWNLSRKREEQLKLWNIKVVCCWCWQRIWNQKNHFFDIFAQIEHLPDKKHNPQVLNKSENLLSLSFLRLILIPALSFHSGFYKRCFHCAKTFRNLGFSLFCVVTG